MSKQTDIEDLLGDTPAAKPAKPKKAAAPAKAEKPAAKPAKAEKAPKEAAAAPKAEKAPKAPKEAVVFAEGEREALMKRIPKLLKNPINSRDLAAKLEIQTRKLRPVLYALERAGTVKLESSASRTAGMMVTAAPAA